MGPVAEAVEGRKGIEASRKELGLARSRAAHPSGAFLARVSDPSVPRRVKLPAVVAMTRERLFELSATAHSVSSSLRGLGLEPQVAMLDRMVADLEAFLVAQARAWG